MHQTNKQKVASMLKAQYAPYSDMHAFMIGTLAYAKGNWRCPYSGQAWDRGLEYAMRLART